MKYVYVTIPRINGRRALVELAEFAERNGFGFVEYDEGGWADRSVHNIAPHLRFEKSEDALAYILARGGEFHSEVPEMIPGKDYMPGG